MSANESLQSRLEMNDEERELYPRIIARIWAIAGIMGKTQQLDYIKLCADVLFCHKLHCPLKLRDWLNAGDIDFIADTMAIYHNFEGTPIYALRPGVSLRFAVSNESRIWVPENFSHERKH